MPEQSTTQNNNNGFAIASLVLGVISVPLVLAWLISIPTGILAIIFGAISLKSPGRSMALAGLITGCVGLFLSVMLILFVFLAYFASI
ncbi:MAG TPA: DUF4190 domain-containing protein [Candidatus Saccharibacteria bacterium]|nr:DUF4190 domain-containing protein [Candidatus Saccharibacteria bacterium]HRQ07217.1 DUF4190 domain-containing protein [Candidatus Saccharibacteria bacterium]